MGDRIIRCSACREWGKHGARGWCKRCYNRWLRYGRPESGPPKPQENDTSLPSGRERHYSQVPDEWNDDQLRAAKRAVLVGKDVAERRLFLEALGLVDIRDDDASSS